jgi:hypothetical protein
MVEQLKSIVEHLKRAPFNRKDYNILSFDNLSNNQLLQVLTDVLAVADPYDPSVGQSLLSRIRSSRMLFGRHCSSTKSTFVTKSQRRRPLDT